MATLPPTEITLREFGKLPAAMKDTFLSKHLSPAIYDAEDVLTKTRYAEIVASGSEKEQDRLEEAIHALALAKLLPLAHTFYVEGVPELNKDGPGARWMDPREAQRLAEISRDRGERILESLKTPLTAEEEEDRDFQRGDNYLAVSI